MYERITIRHPHPYEDFITINETKQLPDTEQSRKVLNRLCDLEDKIEQGEIVELPCAVGDTVYCIRYDRSRKPYIKPLRVLSITTYGEDVVTLFTTRDDRLGLTVFLTPEEANKKLKELENEN